jgi:hypothetical protein
MNVKKLWWRLQADGDLCVLDCKMVSSGVKLTDDEFLYFIEDRLDCDCLAEQLWAEQEILNAP